MSPKCMLVSALLLGSVNVAIAMEVADEVEMKITESSLFYNQDDIDYVCDEFWDKKTLYEIHGEKVRCEYTMFGFPFEPRKLWGRPIEEQLVYFKDAIQELDLLVMAPKYHHPLEYTDDKRAEERKKHTACAKLGTYSKELEEKFEVAVHKILSKDYKITLEEFVKSLRSALKTEDRLYKAPLLMHFTNYLVPRYEFYYKTKNYKRESEPYKTLKYPSIFEIANGAKNVGVVVYEKK